MTTIPLRITKPLKQHPIPRITRRTVARRAPVEETVAFPGVGGGEEGCGDEEEGGETHFGGGGGGGWWW